MRWVSWRSKSGWILAFLAGVVVGSVHGPIWKSVLVHWAQDDFSKLTFRCDTAMREHLIAKARLASQPRKEAAEDLGAAEVALIDCQDYDLMRKRLLLLGLTENELSLMGLRAIEERASDLRKVVEIHEIRY